MQILLTY